MSSAEEAVPSAVQAAAEARYRVASEIWNRDGLEAFAERFWHPDIVWEEPAGFPDGGVRHGRDACVRRMGERLSLLGHVQLEIVEVTAISEGQHLIEAVVRGEGAASGAPAELRQWFLNDVREGMTVRFREFLDQESALAAVRAAGEDQQL